MERNFFQGKNGIKQGSIWLGFFLAAKIKSCLSTNDRGIIEEYEIFKGFSEVNKCLVRTEKFKIIEGKYLLSKQPLGWKKSFQMGVLGPNKERNCGDCKENFFV